MIVGKNPRVSTRTTPMTATGYEQTFSRPKSTSALPPKADQTEGSRRSPYLTHFGSSGLVKVRGFAGLILAVLRQPQ